MSDRFVPILTWQEMEPREKDRHLAVLEQLPLDKADAIWLQMLEGFEDDRARQDRIRKIVSELPDNSERLP